MVGRPVIDMMHDFFIESQYTNSAGQQVDRLECRLCETYHFDDRPDIFRVWIQKQRHEVSDWTCQDVQVLRQLSE